MSQDKGTDLPSERLEPIDGPSKAPTPVPTTILEDKDYQDLQDIFLKWNQGKRPLSGFIREVQDYYNTKYTTRLKKCIGEIEPVEPSMGFDFTTPRNELRAEIIKNWKEQ
jgi:hypothetical protein